MARSRLKRRFWGGSSTDDDLTGRLVTILEPGSIASEDYRTLRTNLLYALVDDPPKVIVITSPGPGEGKSTTCANLGVVLAQADKSTLLVDCDLRKPAMHKLFGLRNFRGLTQIISGEHSLAAVWKEPFAKLKVVAAGPVPPNPAELLGSKRFAELVDQASQEFDYVLLDAPPVEMVGDAMIVASRADGVLLVLNSQSTRRGALRRAMRSLDAVGANVMGTVMNNARPAKSSYYSYGYTFANSEEGASERTSGDGGE